MKRRTGLLGGWAEELERRREEYKQLPPPLQSIAVDVPALVKEVQLVDDAASARQMIDTLSAVVLRALAIDSEFGNRRPEIELRSGKTWSDIRSIHPKALSVSAWVEPYEEPTKGYIAQYVVDLRRPEVVAVLPALFRLRVPIIAHHLKMELFTLWSLGVDPDLWLIYDTFVAAACIHLGIHHPRHEEVGVGEDDEDVERTRKAAAKLDRLLSLVGQCSRYGLRHPFDDRKTEFQDRWRRLPDNEPISRDLAEYATADATFTLRLYAAQQEQVCRLGLAYHLHGVEFPFTVANSRVEWRGVFTSREAMAKLRKGCQKAARYCASRLQSLARRQGLNITKPGSATQFLALMDALGLGSLFTKLTPGGSRSTEDKVLETLEDTHRAIRLYRLFLRVRRVAREEWLTGKLLGADGRIHPSHRQLGAHTGRNSCSAPNLAGIGRIFRPVVIAPPGRALVELDFAQIEVGVAAAEHGDQALINAYNSGDLYTFMARMFYWNDLTEADRTLDLKQLRKRFPELRSKMKIFVLASLYGMQALSIAIKFKIPTRQAEEELRRFLDLFPGVKNAMEQSTVFGFLRGYAYITSGLRRHLPRQSRLSSWVRNLLRNTPVQGSAAVVFKKAMILLDLEFRMTSTWLVLPIHDAVLIECDKADVEDVTLRASILMAHAVRSFYPALTGKVDANLLDTSCWQKDGHSDSIDRFLEDPLYRPE